jgi:hypothetical protein
MDKQLRELLPTVKLVKPEPRKIRYDTSEEDAYLATLSEEEVKRYKLRQLLKDLSKRGTRRVFPDDPKLQMPKKIKYVATVFTKPFPMMSGYREGDEFEYNDLGAVPFESVPQARRFYMRLLKAYVAKEKTKRRLSEYD